MRKFIILSLGIILIAVACNRSNPLAANNTPNPSPTPAPAPAPTPTPSPTPTITDIVINMTSTGFSQTAVTISKGATVTFKNTDSKNHWSASDPHPIHTDLSAFDAKKAIAPGAEYSFTFTEAGRFKFHDHLNPGFRGSITVVE